MDLDKFSEYIVNSAAIGVKKYSFCSHGYRVSRIRKTVRFHLEKSWWYMEVIFINGDLKPEQRLVYAENDVWQDSISMPFEIADDSKVVDMLITLEKKIFINLTTAIQPT